MKNLKTKDHPGVGEKGGRGGGGSICTLYYITCYLGNITVRDMGNILRYYLGNIWTLFYKAIPGNLVSWKKVLPPLGGGGG